MMQRHKLLCFSCLLSILIMCGLEAVPPGDGENEYRLAAFNRRATTMDTLTSDAGRGVWVAHDPDLDNDGMPEILVTEYQKGGRIFVYEMINNNLMEFVWASPPLSDSLSGGGSTPRSVTTGDFDNNGMQEIIFPIGYFASDSTEFANRGIYFYEFTGTDNDYGTEPAYKLTYEEIDTSFADVNTGRTESGLRVQDIDGDGKSELLFPPRSFSFDVAKLYIMEVESGTFSGGDAVIEHEYIYEEMVQVPEIDPDGYVPCGTDIGDIDDDGFDEIIVAGWTNISSGAGLGFIQIDGPDSYTPGSIVQLANFSAFVVKANPIYARVNDEPVIFLHGTDTGPFSSKMWVMSGIVSDAFATEANITEVLDGVGFWSAWALGDQDHLVSADGDGIDLYLYGGGGRLLDIEYNGSGSVADSASYDIYQVYDLADVYDNLDGLFNDIFTFPGMDLDNDGVREIIASYKGSPDDSLEGKSLASNGFHLFMWEWGDSSNSKNPSTPIFEPQEPRIITPDDYILDQNYPNPFNPSTTIQFELPLNKTISLKVYNTLGQEVATLIDQSLYSAGRHSVVWDGRNTKGDRVASGVYIYKLVFGNFSKSMKMTLTK